MKDEELVERLENAVERLEKVLRLQWERKAASPTEESKDEERSECHNEEDEGFEKMFNLENYGECIKMILEYTRERLERVSFANHEYEIFFPPEEWKVIDENWEELKDAVYRKKVKKETFPYDSLPTEAWRVLDKHFDELARLFHI